LSDNGCMLNAVLGMQQPYITATLHCQTAIFT
jgi:hypothetical protein